MSYQVLARKWRPRNFKEMVGQEHVLRALVNALDHDRLHHAYLFTGTRGVGKTTIARILAKCLNCEEGVSSVPCGECSACTSIAEGRFVDLIEVDAASRTKVEDTRELLENVQYAPTVGRFKVYLIDEVHMLSTHSFNALLKTLEEPPPHVKFLLATTDPQKLPVTILSRCLQFNLKNLSPERIVEHLQYVLGEEQVPSDEAGLWALARAADGSMRDALSLTDQAIAHGGGKLTEVEVGAMLGSIDLTAIADIARALVNRDGTEALAVVQRMAEHAPDYSVALGDLLSVWHRVAIAQTVPDALDNRHGDYQLILELSKALTREDIQLFYQITLLGRRDISLAPDQRVGFEMALLRMLAFQPVQEGRVDPPVVLATVQDSVDNPLEEAAELVKKSESAPELGSDTSQASLSVLPEKSQESLPKQSVVDGIAPNESQASEMRSFSDYPEMTQEEEPLSTEAFQALSHEIHRHEKSEGIVEETGDVSSVDTVVVPPVEVTAENRGTPPTPSVSKIPLQAADTRRWIDIYQGLSIGGILQNTAANLVLLEVSGHTFRFELDINHSSLYEDSHQQRLADVLSEYFNQAVVVEIEVGTVAAETPMAHRERTREERQCAAVDSLKNDLNVRQIIDVFGGVLLENTVKPID